MVKGFFTGKDGKVHPLRESSGKKGKKTAGAVAAAGVAVSMAVAGGDLGAGGALEGADSAASQVAKARVVRARTARATKSAQRGKRSRTWRTMRMKARRQRRDGERRVACTALSFGDIRQFLLHHPCRWLRRELLFATDEDGNTFAISIAWIRMRSSNTAARFKRLENIHGNGDIAPVGRSFLRTRGIRFTAEHYHPHQRGSRVTIAETTPVHGRPHPALLDSAAQVASRFPAP